MYKYFPHTPEDISSMLEKCGAESLDSLYTDVREDIRLKGDYDLPSEKSELEVRAFFDRLGRKNSQLTCFAVQGSMTIMLPRQYSSSWNAPSSSLPTLLIKPRYHRAPYIIYSSISR